MTKRYEAPSDPAADEPRDGEGSASAARELTGPDDPWREEGDELWTDLEAERRAADRQRHLILGTVFFFTLLGGAYALSTNPYVPPGYEGYVFERPRIFGSGGFRGIVSGPGNFGLSLSRHEAVLIDVRPETHTESFDILAKDDLTISFRFHAVLAIEPGQVQRMVEEYGGDRWYPRFVREPLRTYIRDAAQRYAGTEVKAMRDLVTEEVRGRLAEYLEGSPVRLISLVVGHIDYPELVRRAVDSKLAAQQLLEEKRTQMEIARLDAEIRIEEARGESEAQRIINSTLTPHYLQYEAIRAQRDMAQSPNHSTIYIPTGASGIPVVEPLGTRRPGDPQEDER